MSRKTKPLGAAFTPSSSTAPSPSDAPKEESKVVGIGDIGVLDTRAGNVWVAANESAFDEFNKYAAANDNTGMSEMVLNGRLFIVPCGTTARVLESDLFKKQVRIIHENRRHQLVCGRSGYIASEWIRPLPPKTISAKPQHKSKHSRYRPDEFDGRLWIYGRSRVDARFSASSTSGTSRATSPFDFYGGLTREYRN